MNYLNQFGPGIPETLEQAKKTQQLKEEDTRKKVEKEKYSLEFSTKKEKIEEKLDTLDSSLINEDEKNEIISKLEAIYVNNKSKGLEFNLNKELTKVINSMSFESAGEINKKEYLQKNQEIRQKLIEQLKTNTGKEKIKQNPERVKEADTKQESNLNLKEILEIYNKKTEENPIFPIIERLYEQGEISDETINQIGKFISENDNLDINKINFQNNEEKEILKGYLNNLNFDNLNRKQNLLELTKDIKNIPELKDFKIKINNDGNFEEEVLNKIGKNYIKIPDNNGNFDIQKDFSTAILTTKNEILKEVKNIKKDSETFRQAIKNINSGNIKKQLEGINSLYVLAYSNEGILGKKTIDNYKNSRKRQLIKEAQQIEQQLQLQNLIQKQKEQLNKRKEEIKQELSEITGIKDGKKIKSGDIFKATKKETNDSGLEKEQSI